MFIFHLITINKFCDSNSANYEQGVSYQEQKVSEKVKKNALVLDFIHAIPKIATRNLCFYSKSHLFIRPH